MHFTTIPWKCFTKRDKLQGDWIALAITLMIIVYTNLYSHYCSVICWLSWLVISISPNKTKNIREKEKRAFPAFGGYGNWIGPTTTDEFPFRFAACLSRKTGQREWARLCLVRHWVIGSASSTVAGGDFTWNRATFDSPGIHQVRFHRVRSPSLLILH